MNNGIEMLLRQQAEEIAAQGINGWGNTMAMAADEIAELERQVEGLEQYKQEAIDESVIAGYEHMPAAHVIKLMADALSAASERVERLERERDQAISGGNYWKAEKLAADAVIAELEQRLAAQPVAVEPVAYIFRDALEFNGRQAITANLFCPSYRVGTQIALYTAPPAQARPVVPGGEFAYSAEELRQLREKVLRCASSGFVNLNRQSYNDKVDDAALVRGTLSACLHALDENTLLASAPAAQEQEKPE